MTYGLLNAQGRGDTFIDLGAKVYKGMLIGSQRRGGGIPINVCKEKKQTNIRSSTALIDDDELLEVAPLNLRLRKAEGSAQSSKRR